MELKLNRCQQKAFDKMIEFINDDDAKVFILKGYAGTGKTTMMRRIIEELDDRAIDYTLLASTGRAAKILSNLTKHEAKTVHGCIYKFTDLNQDLEKVAKEREQNRVDSSGQLLLNFELQSCDYSDEPHYYIVDEASMIADKKESASQAVFGNGKLLSDLLAYDPTGKFVFIGDMCQLPPVNQDMSPALSEEYFRHNFHTMPYMSELTEIMRQEKGNDIAVSAQKVRNLYFHPQPWKWAKFPLKGYNNIKLLRSQTDLITRYIKQAKSKGYNNSTLLCFSNKQCDTLTGLLRPNFGHYSSKIEKGDLLLVTQNNLISGLMNGDLVTLEHIGTREERAGLSFVQVKVKELFTGRVFAQLLVEDIIYTNQTNLSQSQQKELLIDFFKRMKKLGVKQRTQQFNRAMMQDPYLNALRAVFGYALTCHKAQGGEWENVFLDIPRNVPAMQKPYVYQWVYTAMTRAKQTLYVVDDFWVM